MEPRQRGAQRLGGIAKWHVAAAADVERAHLAARWATSAARLAGSPWGRVKGRHLRPWHATHDGAHAGVAELGAPREALAAQPGAVRGEHLGRLGHLGLVLCRAPVRSSARVMLRDMADRERAERVVTTTRVAAGVADALAPRAPSAPCSDARQRVPSRSGQRETAKRATSNRRASLWHPRRQRRSPIPERAQPSSAEDDVSASDLRVHAVAPVVHAASQRRARAPARPSRLAASSRQPGRRRAPRVARPRHAPRDGDGRGVQARVEDAPRDRISGGVDARGARAQAGGHC